MLPMTSEDLQLQIGKDWEDTVGEYLPEFHNFSGGICCQTLLKN